MKRSIKIIAVIAAVSCLVSCSKASTSNKTAASSVSGTTAAISFTDDDGCKISLSKPCSRIISLYSAHTENLYYLGAGSKIIGRYKTCTFPPEASSVKTYDYNSGPEKIIAAKPDLVLIFPLIAKKVPKFVKALKNAGICVVSLYPQNIKEFDGYITKLAELTGTENKAKTLLADFHSSISRTEKLTSAVKNKKTVFFESTEKNINTVTPDSMAGQAIIYAGGINIAKDCKPISKNSTIAPFGTENLLKNADKIDVYISQTGAMDPGGSKKSISQRAGFSTIKAVKENKIFLISENIISSPTFRYEKGIHEMARFLYPEIMDDNSSYENSKTATRADLANLIVMKRHLQTWLPTSSYYKAEHKGHTYGSFKDVKWNDSNFDYIETAVQDGYITFDKTNDGDYFYPKKNVTRDELVQTVFTLGHFSAGKTKVKISDLSKCKHPNAVQDLVDNGVFSLSGGKFSPNKTVTCSEIINAFKFVK